MYKQIWTESLINIVFINKVCSNRLDNWYILWSQLKLYIDLGWTKYKGNAVYSGITLTLHFLYFQCLPGLKMHFHYLLLKQSFLYVINYIGTFGEDCRSSDLPLPPTTMLSDHTWLLHLAIPLDTSTKTASTRSSRAKVTSSPPFSLVDPTWSQGKCYAQEPRCDPKA